MDKLLALVMADKGRDINRTAVLLLVGWVAYQVTQLDRRLAVIEERLHSGPPAASATTTNHLAIIR